jgi:hypothetical protein
MLSRNAHVRVFAVLLSTCLVIVGAAAIFAHSAANNHQVHAQFAPETPGKALDTRRGEITLIGEVTGTELAGPGVAVNAFCSMTPNLWIVRLKVVQCLTGEFPAPELNVLTHSPSRDLGVRRPGERITLRLAKATGYPSLTWPPHRPRPEINLVDLRDLYRVRPAGV